MWWGVTDCIWNSCTNGTKGICLIRRSYDVVIDVGMRNYFQFVDFICFKRRRLDSTEKRCLDCGMFRRIRRRSSRCCWASLFRCNSQTSVSTQSEFDPSWPRQVLVPSSDRTDEISTWSNKPSLISLLPKKTFTSREAASRLSCPFCQIRHSVSSDSTKCCSCHSDDLRTKSNTRMFESARVQTSGC